MINQQAQVWNKLTQKIFANYKQGLIFGTWGAIGGSIGSLISELAMFQIDSNTSALSLGKQPILLGSSNNSHIYLSKFHGFHPKTASIYIANEKVIMQYEQEYGTSKGMKKLKHELNNGDRRKLGNITIEVKSSI